MIKIENTMVSGWEAAVRGMRNPMNSWDNSDSDGWRVGVSDWALMMRLVKGGTSHRKFLRYVTVSMDVTAPLYWWKEFDIYKIGTVANSCSTMHKLTAKPFEMDDFSHEHLDVTSGENSEHSHRCAEMDAVTNAAGWGTSYGRLGFDLLYYIVQNLNYYRELYIKTKDKFWWWQIIQTLPTSYNQKRTVLLNYEVLRNIYHTRGGHKLDEWHYFRIWCESLPYSELITAKEAGEADT